MTNKKSSNKKPPLNIFILFLFAVLSSFICVSTSTFLALKVGAQDAIPADMLAQSQANYQIEQDDPSFGQINPGIFMEATRDSAQLAITPSARESLRNLASAAISELFPTAQPTGLPAPQIITLNPIGLTAVSIAANTKTPQPTSTQLTQPTASITPTSPPTTVPTQTATKIVATATKIIAATATVTPQAATATQTAIAAPTATNKPAATATNQPNPTTTPTTSPTNTAVPPTSTHTATATMTATATNTAVATNTPTPTAIATSTATPTATTPPPTPTATSSAACPGNIPGGEPNMGPPNGIIGTIPCGQNITLNISANPIVVTGAEPAFDLVFYELENPANQVNLDWVIIEASINGTDTWVQIFNWGNGILDSNTNIGQLGHGSSGEPDNYPLLFADLYGGNSPGIAIDLDALAPPGIYQWVRISSPLGGGNDGAEVDAIQVLP